MIELAANAAERELPLCMQFRENSILKKLSRIIEKGLDFALHGECNVYSLTSFIRDLGHKVWGGGARTNPLLKIREVLYGCVWR
jgi:hypothetical protein